MPKFADGTLNELRILRRLEAAQSGYPFPGVNVGRGPWAPPEESETKWKHAIRRRLGGALRYRVDEELLARAAAATAGQIRTFLGNRGISVTLTEATRLKTLCATALEEDDDGEDAE